MVSVGLLYDQVRWEEKALKKACEDRGVECKLIHSDRLVLEISKDKLEENFGDIVLQRCVSQFKGLHLTAVLESFDVKVVNRLAVAEICNNKLKTTLALRRAGIPVPRTFTAFSSEAALEAFRRAGFPAIIKPVMGSWGRLVSQVNDEVSAKVVIEHREMMFPLYQVYYIQEMVKRPPRDLRVFVVGEEVPVGIYRVNTRDWRTNTALGGRAEPCPITEEIRELALKAAEAVGGGILGVDMMESEGSLVVHEINSTVEFRNTVPATGVDLPGIIVDYLVKEAKR